MPELCTGDEPILLLVEDAETLNEVLQWRNAAVLADRLQDGVEGLKRDACIWRRKEYHLKYSIMSAQSSG